MLSTTVEMIIIGIILLCGYAFLYAFVSRRTSGATSKIALGVILFLIYACFAGALMVVLMQFKSASFIMLSLLLLISCIVLFAAVYGMIHNFSELNKSMLVLFILYMLMVSYITLFSRDESNSWAILLRFDSFREAIRKSSFEPLQHVLLNALMFIPLGILFPLIWRGHLDKLLYVGPMGLMTSTLIEATQLLLHLGQCDMEDIVANTAGAVAGLILYKIYDLFFGRRDDEDEDEEEEE